MLLPWGIGLLNLLAWGVIWLAVDSPAVPIWKTRNAYRGFILWLLLSSTLLAWKLDTFHTELIQVIAGCR